MSIVDQLGLVQFKCSTDPRPTCWYRFWSSCKAYNSLKDVISWPHPPIICPPEPGIDIDRTFGRPCSSFRHLYIRATRICNDPRRKCFCRRRILWVKSQADCTRGRGNGCLCVGAPFYSSFNLLLAEKKWLRNFEFETQCFCLVDLMTMMGYEVAEYFARLGSFVFMR